MGNIQFAEAPQFITVDELISDYQELPSDVYIRQGSQNLSADQIGKKIKDLMFDKSFRVLETIKFFVGADGQRYLLDGNSRRRVLTLVKNDTKYQGYEFSPIPVLEYTGDQDFDTLREVQVLSNDTTLQHSPKQMAQAVQTVWGRIYDESIAAEKTDKQSRGAANNYCAKLFHTSTARISQLRVFLELPDWLLNYVEMGILSVDSAIKLQAAANDLGLDLGATFREIQSTIDPSELTIEDGEESYGRITQTLINKYLAAKRKALADATVENGESGEAFESGSTTTEPKEITAEDAAVYKDSYLKNSQAFAGDLRDIIELYWGSPEPQDEVAKKEFSERREQVLASVTKRVQVVQTVIKQQLFPVDRLPDLYEWLVTFDSLFSVDSLEPSEVAAVAKAADNKPLEKLFAAVFEPEEVQEGEQPISAENEEFIAELTQ